MWNSLSTDQQLGLSTQTITYSGHDGDTIHAYVARPAATGPHPGIVAVHHLPGWDEFSLEFADRLARHGYLVIMPDLYCRHGHGQPAEVAGRVQADGGSDDPTVIGDCAAALDWLRDQSDYSGRAGIIGPCSGGRHALLTASQVPGFDAVVDLWGGGVVPPEGAQSDQKAPPNPRKPFAGIELTSGLSAPLLGLFGNDDQHPTPAQVDQHEAELRKHGKDYEFHRYDGAGHGFFYYHTPLYRQKQAMEGWERVLAFFGQHLAS